MMRITAKLMSRDQKFIAVKKAHFTYTEPTKQTFLHLLFFSPRQQAKYMMPGASKNKQRRRKTQIERAELFLIWCVTNDLEPLL